MFVDGYCTYENFMDAATRSLQAVEAAFRVRLDAEPRPTFDRLIDQAKARGLVGDDAHEILHERPHSIGVESTTHTSSLHSVVSRASVRLTCKMSSAALRSRLLQLRVAELRRDAHRRPPGSELRRVIQQIIGLDIKSGREGVQLCLHTPTLDSLPAGAQAIP
jgi:hypothetical protein